MCVCVAYLEPMYLNTSSHRSGHKGSHCSRETQEAADMIPVITSDEVADIHSPSVH